VTRASMALRAMYVMRELCERPVYQQQQETGAPRTIFYPTG